MQCMHSVIRSNVMRWKILHVAVTKNFKFLFSWNVQYAGKHYSHRSLCFYRTMTHPKAEDKCHIAHIFLEVEIMNEWMNEWYLNKLNTREQYWMRVLQIFLEATFVSSFVRNYAIFSFYFIDLDIIA